MELLVHDYVEIYQGEAMGNYIFGRYGMNVTSLFHGHAARAFFLFSEICSKQMWEVDGKLFTFKCDRLTELKKK